MNSLLEKQPNQVSKGYAGFWIRFAAYLIDSVVIGIPTAFIIGVFFVFMISTTETFEAIADPTFIEAEITSEQIFTLLASFAILLILSIGITVAYFAGMHASKWQATVGKKLLRLKVTDLYGNRISFWRAFGRLLAMSFLSGIFYVGYIITAFTDKKQSLHDLIAGTLVIREE